MDLISTGFLTICCAFFVLLGIGAMAENYIGAIFCFLGAVLLFPRKKWQLTIEAKLRIDPVMKFFAALVLFADGMVYCGAIDDGRYVFLAFVNLPFLFVLASRFLRENEKAASQRREAEEQLALLAEETERRMREIEERDERIRKLKAERFAEGQRKKAEAEAEAARQKALWEEDHRPVQAILIMTSETVETRASGIIGRALIGGVLFGEAGAMIGGLSARKKNTVEIQEATFSVKYASGRVGTETVRVGSDRFNELAALLYD